MVRHVLQLRLRQIYRMIQEIGPGLIVLGLIITMGLTFKLLAGILEWPIENVLALGSFIIIVIHFSRTDLPFLSQISKSRLEVSSLLFFEYLLSMLPLIFFYGIMSKWLNVGSLCLMPLLAFVLPQRSRKSSNTTYKKSLSWIPLDVFELKFQMEKHWIAILFIFGLCLVSFYHISIFLVSILSFLVLIVSTFKYSESKEIIHWDASFLSRKIWKNSLFVFVLLLPLMVISGIAHSDYFLVILYGLLCVFTLLIFSILFKYSRINPLFMVEHDTIASSIYFLFLLLPGGILITIGYSILLYFKAQKNLTRFYA